MKKRVFAGCLAAAMIVAAFTACGRTKNSEANINANNTKIEQTATTENVAGGWTTSAETGSTIPADALKAFDKAFQNYGGVNLEPIKYLGSQVVAGTNFKLLCKSTPIVPNAESKYVVVTVYQDLDGNAEITAIDDYDMNENTAAAPEAETKEADAAVNQNENNTVENEVQMNSAEM